LPEKRVVLTADCPRDAAATVPARTLKAGLKGPPSLMEALTRRQPIGIIRPGAGLLLRA